MAASAEKSPAKPANDDVQLSFTRIPGSSALEVTLPSGERFRVERNRERVTPGVGGLGPSTGALYEVAIEELGPEILSGSVVDLGGGCGVGARILATHAKAAVCVESNAIAVKFARLFAANATILEARIEDAKLPAPVDGAVLVDVLGFVDAPLATLRAARSMLRVGGRIVVVEPLAYPAQILIPPVRRATAPVQLAGMLEAAGFNLLRCATEGGVVVATAEAIDSPYADRLTRGAAACASGDLEAALGLFDTVSATAPRTLAVQAVLDAVDLLVAQGRGDDACTRLLSILRRFPEEPRPLAALSQFMVAAGEASEAKLLAEKASRLSPLDPAVIAALAIALDVSNDPGASVAWRRAFNLAPDALEIAIPAATSALEHAHPLLAERILIRCMDYAGNATPPAFFLRARVRIALGRIEDAKLDARLALAGDPDSQEIRNMITALDAASAA
jgi:tetratricopeptide (TPR) repeat protein